MENLQGLRHIRDLMEKGRIRPLIGKVFPFSEAVAAYTLLQNGPSPGKLVLKM
jgi:NADPH:quinone reductase-like Zn-dependent oxidoreductase